jgi:hypothetical protein
MLLVSVAFTRAASMGLLVPAYFYPESEGILYWQALSNAATRVPIIAIMNPGDGPGESLDTDYLAVVTNLQHAGGQVIGYIATGYATSNLATVKTQIDLYLSWYPVNGFFVDEMFNEASEPELSYYTNLYHFIKSQNPALTVIGNPGTFTAEEYLTRPAADRLVVFEHFTGYETNAPDAWNTNHPPDKLAHLMYAVGSASTMTNYIQLARQRNAGWIYVTDDGVPDDDPWNTLTTYWLQEVEFIRTLLLASTSAITVSITNPANGAVFLAPTNFAIHASAGNTNGIVAQVAFYAGTNRLAIVTNAPYSFIWTNALAGTNLLTAVATDALGVSATSAPVTVTVNLPPPGPPVFSLGSGSYSVNENGGVVVITVLKSQNSLAGTVNYTTANGSAVAVSGGLGDFQAMSGSLSFTNGEASKTVTVPILDDPSYEGNQQFAFALGLSGGNATLASPSTTTITILDDDPPATTNSFLEILFPAAVPQPHNGQLRVFTEPANAGGQWRLIWETAWRNSGDILGGLPSGNYEVEFRPVAGYFAPFNTTNPVLAGQLTTVTNQYAVNGAPQFGSLAVTLAPASLASQATVALRAQWRLQGDTNWQNSGFRYAGLAAGNYIVEFKSLADWAAPASRVVLVPADQETSVSAVYLVADASGGTVPSVLPSFTDATVPVAHQPPYPWMGQLLTDSGYGSGVVVKRRVVLTAAHVVFDDATLSYVTRVNWFFQRWKGVYEPPAQTPRGWYAFSGYAAARTNDHSPGVSSPTSQNLDVAALYFLADAGRGGQSGYLVSEPDGTEWLQLSPSKTLLGYPVEGVSENNRSRLHATVSGNLTFQLVSNRVFSTASIRGYPGMSGGPLCVQSTNDAYYPAAVYLGGSAQTVVRAIDGAVADLINRADLTANTGDNSTGGGLIQLVAGAGALFTPGFFQIIVEPPEAVTLGAGWRIVELTNATFLNDNTATYGLPPATYTLTNRPVFGFLAPSNRALQVVANQTAIITNRYVALAPRATAAVSNGALSLKFSAPPGQRYAIERSTNLTLTNWTAIVTSTVAANGSFSFTLTNIVSPPYGFYRARLAP